MLNTKKLLFSALLLFVTIIIHAQVVMTYDFGMPVVKNSEDGYTEFLIPECYNLGEEGTPLLPYYAAHLLLPPGHSLREIKVISVEYGLTYNNVDIRPAPGYFPISVGAPDGYKPVPDAAIYQSANNYPAGICSTGETHFLAGHSIGMFTICPLVYNPAASQVRHIRSISIEVVTETTGKARQAEKMLKNHPSQIRRISRIVDNISLLEKYTYTENKTGEYDILFITHEDLEPYFEPYISFKTGTGYIVKTLTTGDIYSQYSGIDEQDKIRNCIIDYYDNHDIFAVILGGDADKNNPSQNFVPHRGFYGTVDNDHDIPADMYYACLDGTWNDDGDLRWGEPGEEDLFAEVIVGRIAVDDSTEIAHFTHKLMMYQDQPVVDDIEKALMIGESLDSYTWGGDSKDEVATGSANHGITTAGLSANFNIEYLYERDGWWNKTHVYSQFNNTGINLLNHLGHSNTNYNMKMYTSDLTTTNFTNDGISRGYVIGYSQGCYNGAFDNRGTNFNSYGADCFAEKITTIETAQVACVANSRYGLYSPGNTNGPSQYFDREFFDAIFGEGLSMIGEANSDSKEDLAAFIMGSNGLRWCCYTLNVFGDPTLDIWTAAPAPIVAVYPAAVPLGTSGIYFQTDAPGARIGLMQNGELIGRGLADASGNLMVNLFAQLGNTDTISVSVIAHNRERLHGHIVVVAEQPFVCYESHAVIDSITGNGNGLPEYGETVKLSLEVTNMGQQDATDVTVFLTSADPYVLINDSVEYYGNIGPGQTVMIGEGYEFSLGDDVPNGHEVMFTVRAEGQETWISNFFLMACAPDFSSGILSINDSLHGNGNAYLDPGETADIHIVVTNSGNSPVSNISAEISVTDTLVSIISGSAYADSLDAGDSFVAVYTLSTHPLSQRGATFELTHSIEAGAYQAQQLYDVPNGIICEDWETGDFSRFNWVHAGQDGWETMDVEPFEGIFSARSGNIGDNEKSVLQLALNVQHDDSISFYRKVSSEPSDFLNFYINNELKGQWSGEEGWENFSYAVEQGVTFFKWEYIKNVASASGDDCAWLDYIVLPYVNTASAYAGPDQLICAGNICQLQGQAAGYTSLLWSTDGDGMFDNPQQLQTIYTPGPEDIASGMAQLSLAATFNQTGTSFDSMLLEIDEDPGTPDIPDGPDYVDLLTVTSSEYTIPPVPSVISYEWHLEPLEAGTITGTETTGTVNWEPSYHGLAYVSARAVDSCGAGPYSPEFEILVDEGGLFTADPGQIYSRALYPNPSKGSFTLEVWAPGLDEAELRICHASGKQIYRESVKVSGETYKKYIHLGSVPRGIYFLQFSGNGFTFNEKIILNP